MITSHTLNVHFWLKKSSVRKDGTFPIYARISIGSASRVDLSTKQNVLEQNWCDKSSRVGKRIKDARRINDELDTIYSEIKKAYKELRNEGVPISAKAVKLRCTGKDRPVSTIRDLIQYHTENDLKKLAPGTAKNYAATEKYILRFVKSEYKCDDIYLSQIDYTFIVKFEDYLRDCKTLKKAQPLNNNGRMKHLERLKKFTTLALKHRWIKSNPFALYQLKYEDFDCPFLEENELKTISSITLTDDSLSIVRDVFVFSCYTGLCYIEVKNLKTGDIVNGIDKEDWIMVRRQKSKTPVKLPLLEQANRILEKYQEVSQDVHTNKLLPVFSDQKINKYLKEIAKLCKIEKNLTFHVARHTFATTVTLLNDVPIETVSKMLGHTKLSTTQKYARVVEQKISKDMSSLRSKLKKAKSKSTSIDTNTGNGHLHIV